MRNNDKRELIFDDYYRKFDLNLDESEYIVPGLDKVRGVFENYNYELIHKDTVFPLRKIKFNNEYYPCPNDYDMYLKSIYGDYIYLPKKIYHHHYLLNDLRNVENIDLLSEIHISKMKIINENYSDTFNYTILKNVLDESEFIRIYNLGDINYDKLSLIVDDKVVSVNNIQKSYSKVLGDYVDIPASLLGVGIHTFSLKYKENIGKKTNIYVKDHSNLLDCNIVYGSDSNGVIRGINTGKGQKIESSSEWSSTSKRSIKITRMGDLFVWTDIPLVKSIKKGTKINMELTFYSECSPSIFFVYNNKGKQSFSNSIRFKKGDYNKKVFLTDELLNDVNSVYLRVRINDKNKSYLFIDGLNFSVEK
jgi:phosphorylcholine metabolism protein LicD